MSTFLSKLYRVRKDDTVTLKITIGHGQVGTTIVNLSGNELVTGHHGSLELTLPGTGETLSGKTLYCSTTVADIQTATNETSVTYVLEGGAIPFKQTLQETVESHGDVVFYTAVFRFYM